MSILEQGDHPVSIYRPISNSLYWVPLEISNEIWSDIHQKRIEAKVSGLEDRKKSRLRLNFQVMSETAA